MKLFAQRPMYVMGKVRKTHLHTYNKRYSVKLPFSYSGDVLARITTDAEIFFENRIFNSYMVAEEENVYVLHQSKLTFMVKEEKLLKNKIYIFEVIEETATYKKVCLYKKKVYQGHYKNGKFVYKESSNESQREIKGMHAKTLSNTDQHKTYLCKGTLIIQKNHSEDDLITAEKISDNLFVEINNQLKEIKGVVVSTDPYVIQDRDVKVFVHEKSILKKGDIAVVSVIREMFGKYVGTFNAFNIKVGMVADALVKNITDRAIFVEINGVVGRLKLDECYKVNTKYVRGIVYRVDESNRRFEFSTKRYLNTVRENELNNAIVNLPFVDSDDDLCEARFSPSSEGKQYGMVDSRLERAQKPEFCRDKKIKLLDAGSFKNYLERLITTDTFVQMSNYNGNKLENISKLAIEIKNYLKYEEILNVLDNNMEKKGLRGMFKELVQIDWGVEKMREIFKKWLEYEKNYGGDVEIVKKTAKEYVTR
ncbi:MAG: hypothetical protein O7C59_09370 [Rickettsia endosymbiont of Ixodes persulcatus]|nr:hypothetical protein [Rickettsia endosymbiont of Ixodes persulcatus]